MKTWTLTPAGRTATRSLRARLLVLSGLLTGGIASNAGATVFADVSLAQAGPGSLNLVVFNVGPTTLSASNSGTLFNGNVGLGPGASTNVSGGGTISGNLYVDPSATVQGNFASQFNINGTTITQSLSQAVTAVQNAATLAAQLAPDQTFGSIGGTAMTLLPTGSVNGLGGHNTVVSIGDISITNPSHNLTINGGANDFFIINVGSSASTGNVINVTNGAISLSGGIPANHVLFNVLGMGDVTLTNGSSSLAGTYLAPFSGQSINLTPGTVTGAVIGYNIHTSSGPNVIGSPYVSSVPAPGPFALGGAALALAAKRRRRA